MHAPHPHRLVGQQVGSAGSASAPSLSGLLSSQQRQAVHSSSLRSQLRYVLWATLICTLSILALFQPTPHRRPHHGRCASGPYVYTPDCGEGEGIGSRLNHIKLALLYALRTHSNYIHSPKCFFTDHDTDDLFENVLAFGGAEDCNEQELFRGANDGSMRIFEFSHPIGKRGMALVKETLELDEDELASGTAALSSDSFIFETQKYAQDRRNWRTAYVIRAGEDPESHAIPDQISAVQIVPVESYLHTRDWIANKYKVAFQEMLRQGRRSPISFEKGYIHIAIHRRWGDIASKPGQDLDPRTFSISYYIKLLENVLDDYVMKQRRYQIHVFSESNKEELGELLENFPKLKFWPGSAHTVIQDLDHLAHADILITCRSSFSSLAAALNQDGVILAPASDKFEGIDNIVIVERDGTFDRAAFRAAVIGARLYKDEH